MKKEKTPFVNSKGKPLLEGDVFQSCMVGDIFCVRKLNNIVTIATWVATKITGSIPVSEAIVNNYRADTWVAVNLRNMELHRVEGFKKACIVVIGNAHDNFDLLKIETHHETAELAKMRQLIKDCQEFIANAEPPSKAGGQLLNRLTSAL